MPEDSAPYATLTDKKKAAKVKNHIRGLIKSLEDQCDATRSQLTLTEELKTDLHVARLHSTNVAYSPLHTLSPATTIHTVYVLQYYRIPSAYPLRSKSGRDGQMGARTLEHRHIF